MPKTRLNKLIEEDVVETETIKKEIQKTKKVFEQSDGIMCRSVVSGPLYVEGPKTGMIYSFSDYDDESEIEYRDLVALVRSKDKAVFEPRFTVVDEDFIKEFPSLEKFYVDQFTTKDIKAILDMPEDEMATAIKRLPSGAVESFKTIAAKQVANGRLDSIKKIKILNELLGIDLDLIGELLAN